MNDSKREEDRRIDEALEESFPASDPPAATGETGVRVGDPEPLPAAIDNTRAQRFELVVDGDTSFLTYQRAGDTLTLLHTEVPERLRGHHLGDALVKAALDAAAAEGRRAIVVCPFARAYLHRHPRR